MLSMAHCCSYGSGNTLLLTAHCDGNGGASTALLMVHCDGNGSGRGGAVLLMSMHCKGKGSVGGGAMLLMMHCNCNGRGGCRPVDGALQWHWQGRRRTVNGRTLQQQKQWQWGRMAHCNAG
jgi:hypothetical protein